MQTNKRTGITRTNFTTARASLRSHIRIDFLDNLALHFGFVSDKLLQLEKTPTIEPSIQSFSFVFVPTLPNTFEVFQDNNICISNNIFGDVVVDMTHKSFLPTRNFFKKSLSRLSAFALQFSPKILILHNLGFVTTEHLAIRSDSEVIYSDINTNNIIASNFVDDNVFRECDVQEIPILSISYEVGSLVSPSEVFDIIVSDMDWNINPSVIDCQSDRIGLECECSPVVSQGNGLEDNFILTGFKRFKSSCNSINAELRFQLKFFSHIIIDKFVQCKFMFNLMLKCFISSVLTGFQKLIIEFNKLRLFRNLDFDCYSHNAYKVEVIYKSNEVKSQFIPSLKTLGILETRL